MKNFLFILFAFALNVIMCADRKHYFLSRRYAGGVNDLVRRIPVGLYSWEYDNYGRDGYDYSRDGYDYSRDDDHYSRDDAGLSDV
ncbi:hypothetical protein K1T71_014121 [Dendrolimus kikuchii]|uniref:Uncharacterized protein n=1 Tax=Dendrolimus kikuchii TaxID=765133 RepID=A0ACC1CF30_9NEOP|nr:hypothetical protein K1T71_014121 [Dendrolimus kikuchii]